MSTFDEKELKVVATEPDFFGSQNPIYDFPVSRRENFVAAIKDKKPYWEITDIDQNTFTPSVIPDNVARGFVFEGGDPLPREKFGGKDMFDIEWVYIDVAGGSMVKPGNPLLEYADEWREKVVWPDINSWDWEGSAKRNKEYLSNGKANIMTLLNGCWFERLISFFDFENAAVAVIDEDQIDDVKELVHKLTDLYIDIVDKSLEYFDLDGFEIHDDWGSQKSPFFSDAAAREIFLPEMKRYNEHLHSKGLISMLHSCGHIEDRCDVFVEAGFDAWLPMPMNDTVSLYEKYGDKITIGMVYDKPIDPATASEEEIRAAAKDFADRFAKPGRPSSYSAFYNTPGLLNPAFREELYRESRKNYGR